MKSFKLLTVILVVFFALSCVEIANAESYSIISTVAGTGTRGYTGDGGDAAYAEFNQPLKVVIDSSGNMYIADTYNDVIRKIDNSGNISTVAGTGEHGYTGDEGKATFAQLKSPEGVAVDSSGNIFISDTYNNVIRKVNNEGIISTVAGTGDYGYSGDEGEATSVQLAYPRGIAVDNSGNIYIADAGNNVIRKVNTDGIITTIAGTVDSGYTGDDEDATSAKLDYPIDVTVDSEGNIYIADCGNNCIRKVDNKGIISTVAGTGYSGYSGDGGEAIFAQLDNPEGLILDRSGNIYIADTGNHVIRKIDFDSGNISTVAGTGDSGYSGDGGEAIFAQFDYPTGVAVDNSGNIYIADCENNAIRKVYDGIPANPAKISTVAGTGIEGYSGDGGEAILAQLRYPCRVAVDSSGNIYIADNQNHRIRKIDVTSSKIFTVAGTGECGYSADGTPATSAKLGFPEGVAVDSSGNIYIANGYTNVIQKIDVTSSKIFTVAGIPGTGGYSGDDKDATLTHLNYPEGITVDSSGNIYIADSNNHRIRKVDTKGIITTVAGTGDRGYSGDEIEATAAMLNYPEGVAVDSIGNIYIADSNNNRIRKVDTDGIITTVAGTGCPEGGYSGDGREATEADLDTPVDVLVDRNGNIYIVDSDNNRIRKVDNEGIISTVAGTGTDGYSGDGGLATSAELNGPYGIAIDNSGIIYIADTFNHVIRRVCIPSVLDSVTITDTIPTLIVGEDGYDLSNLTIIGKDQYNNPYDITGETVNWTIISGSDHAILDGSILSPVSAGSGKVTATINGVTSNQVNFIVNPEVTIITSNLTDGVVGTPYQVQLEAIGGTESYIWSIEELPDFLSLNSSTGEISGTPENEGNYNLTATVTDANGKTDTKSFTLIITSSLNILDSITITNTIPALIVGEDGYDLSNLTMIGKDQYNNPYDITGETVNWTIVSGSDYASLNGSILNPLSAGSGKVTATINGVTSNQVNFIVNPEVTIITSNLTDGVVGTPYQVQLEAIGGTEPYTWSIEGLPDSLSLNSTTGEISGTPENEGTYNLTATVTDTNGKIDTKSFTLTINLFLKINLSNLTISSGTLSPTFNSQITEYTVRVANSISTVTVTPTLSDINSSITVNGEITESGIPSQEIKLNVGENTINVVVTGRDEISSKTYTIIITRLRSSSDSTRRHKVMHPVDKAMQQGEMNEERQLVGVLELENEEGEYEQDIPIHYFIEENKLLKIQTPLASVTLPDNIFTEKPKGEVLLSIKEISKSKLSEDIKKQFENKPIIDIDIKVNGKKIECSSVIVEIVIPYEPTQEELENPNNIIAVYIADNGEVIPIFLSSYDSQKGGVVIRTRCFNYFGVQYAYKYFQDIGSYTWAKEAIGTLAARKVINGIADKEFAPHKNITRADFVILITRFFGFKGEVTENFSDIEDGAYYYDAVGIAKKIKLVSGTGENKFKPLEPITRQDMMVIIKRALEIAGQDSKLKSNTSRKLSDFNDSDKVANYAKDSVEYLINKGIISGDGENINPTSYTKRAEVAVLFYKLFKYIIK